MLRWWLDLFEEKLKLAKELGAGGQRPACLRGLNEETG
jgi:hypothetical protein